MKGPLPSVIALQATPSDVELLLLRSIEWMMFEDGTYDTALEQAIVILRYFLGAGRVSLAKNLVEMLPRDLASIDKPEERATEYFHYTDCYFEHRVRQLEEWLADALKNFRLHQEGLIARIPKLVRCVTMGEFADTYDGDIQACLRGLVGGAPPDLEIDRETRKRKWLVKVNAPLRMKKPPPTNTGTAQCVRTFSAAVPRTPGQLRPTFRLPSISPQKASTLQTSPSKLRAPLPFKVPPSPGTSPHPPRLPSPKRTARVPEPPVPKPATPSLLPSSSLSSLPSSSSARAVVAISTSDGHVLEFDPLQMSPRALNALVGITDSAKKQAREEMGRLVQAAVNKWSIA
ncbi:hypothetical protein BD769DRAFT_1734392 [Suillus cothurnatus]|nr:hypothetical protein BD769DRAFT_1734392 [Suillus cothurnatus]